VGEIRSGGLRNTLDIQACRVHVYVGINQARHQDAACAVDSVRIGVRRAVRDFADDSVLNNDVKAFAQGFGIAIEDARGLKNYFVIGQGSLTFTCSAGLWLMTKYDRNMPQVHMSEAELAQNLHAALERVRNGEEILVERDHRPVAIIRAPDEPCRPVAECIAIAKMYEERLGYPPLPDPDFAADVQAAIDAHREPLETPEWD
jgi:hypothetical protein